RTLIQVVQLETGLHGYETAVKRLQQEPWPREATARAALGLYYAQGLAKYRHAYSWEIEDRERIASADKVDISLWTGEQISTEVDKAYATVWAARETLGGAPVGTLRRYLEPNSFPRGVRDTLRDAVTYLWVEFLGDTSLWQPEHSNELYRLELSRLITSADATEGLDLTDPEIHPLVKLTAVLADLESWHLALGREEGALEARLERLRRLRESFSAESDVAEIRSELERILETFERRLPWWSAAAAELAELLRAGSDPWSLVEAREVALRGEEAHPESVGGRRCRYLVEAIEAPDYAVAAMATDGFERRSIEVTHKNLNRLHFRAWTVDVFERIASSRDFNLLPGGREIEDVLASGKPDFTWTSELEESPDYRRHRTFVTPPVDAPGLYLIVASADAGFSQERNELQAVYLNVSDLVLLIRRDPGVMTVTVRSGESGRPTAGSEVSLFRYDYSDRGHRLVERSITGRDGRVRLGGSGQGGSYFIVARSGDHFALDPAARSFPRRRKEKEQRTALLFTDRSVYRPRQEILWKAVAYRGRHGEGRFETLADKKFTVELMDANGELVERADVESNAFGSASGRFRIPSGRLLGGWWLRTNIGGSTTVRVEEYKRPTFEVTLADAHEALRLNHPATINGESRYYFGLPVVEGNVRWRVTRTPVFPRWWSWWFDDVRESGEQTVASGEASLDRDGRFEFDFLPAADERDAGSGVNYRYRASVEVTDEGGETRGAEKVFRLGFVAVEAVVESEREFFTEDAPGAFSVRRSDLDGTPRAGEASWRLVALEQPETVLLPAEVPLPIPPSSADTRPPFRTVGDGLRPRWSATSDPAVFLRSWSDGDEMLRGSSRHGDDGVAMIRLPPLAAGAYRLYYRTSDAFGAEFETLREFVVVGVEGSRLAVPIAL
ncbi:MAG: MG2 domain-containing protein, partial [Acidobacteriota bacterium]|nr:MG2 domain-containing protein [Acidobacteriota bacterium]